MSARARAEAAKRVLHHENSKIHEEHEKDLCCLLRVFVSFVLSWLALGDCLQEDDRLTPPWTIFHLPSAISHQPSAITIVAHEAPATSVIQVAALRAAGDVHADAACY